MNSAPSATMPGVDLSNCDREPIHTPGHVQPHGMLLALDPASLKVVQWSVNALTALGLSVDQLRERPLRELIDSHSFALVEQLVASGTPAVMTPLQTVFASQAASGVLLGM